MTAPIGAVVRITYDLTPGQTIVKGDVLQTPSGRLYRVVDHHMQRKGAHVGTRVTISAIVIDTMPVDERRSFDVSHDLYDAPDGATVELDDGMWERIGSSWMPRGTITVHPLYWNPRTPRTKR